jgi:hypothetical protein
VLLNGRSLHRTISLQQFKYPRKTVRIFLGFFLFSVLEIKPKASHILGKKTFYFPITKCIIKNVICYIHNIAQLSSVSSSKTFSFPQMKTSYLINSHPHFPLPKSLINANLLSSSMDLNPNYFTQMQSYNM